MKELLAAYCCLLVLQSFAQVPDSEPEQKNAGKKVLIKAISSIVNSESNKKAPVKQVNIPSSTSPVH